MSALDDAIKHNARCLKNWIRLRGCSCESQNAVREMMNLRSENERLKEDNSRLAQENIKLNNNEDFLDAENARLKEAAEEAELIIKDVSNGIVGTIAPLQSTINYSNNRNRAFKWLSKYGKDTK